MTQAQENSAKLARTANHTSSDHAELTPGSFGWGKDISHIVVIKDKDVFFLSQPDGCVPPESGHGFGLYYHDCRFLNTYEFRIEGRRPEHLAWNAESGRLAVIALTNPEIINSDGAHIHRHSVGIRWARMVDGSVLTLHDVTTFQNLTSARIDFSFSISFMTAFEDLFEIRGMSRSGRGSLSPPSWRNGHLELAYEGADGVHRSLLIEFSMPVLAIDATTCTFALHLQPKESHDLLITLSIGESRERLTTRTRKAEPFDFKRIDATLHDSEADWLQGVADVRTNSISLNRIIKRSRLDLKMLRSYIGQEEYFAAGVPWFVALFGRDSIITSLQMMAYDVRIAEHTISLLAAMQGQRLDAWRDEEPGKILHELRVGEMANLGEVPHTPYYGTVDATPLFLILIGRHAAWTGDLSVFNSRRKNIEEALDWISRHGDLSGNGYLEYQQQTDAGLLNQGWKDSTDAIVNSDGSLAAPPIALVEVQGYVYQAKLEMAALYRRAGEVERADQLRREAVELKRRFNEDFWVQDGFYALALQQGKRRADVMSSNAGHTLWTGIAEWEKASQTVKRLMDNDMFNGWGVRTLSESETRYNPLGYHLGTVWPHDNSLIVSGMRRYGFDEESLRLFVALVEAAALFDQDRLPELFAGFSKEKFGVPVNYPVACQPQAWAAGSIPYMVTTLLGLIPEAFDHRLRVRRPILPHFVNEVEIRRLRVGAATVDLKFERTMDTIAVKVLDVAGRLDVVLEL